MRRTVPSAILLIGLGTAGLGMAHCGETTSSVGAVNGQACSPVGSMERASDGCNACTCSQSELWACTTVACAAPDGGGDSTVGPGGGDASGSDAASPDAGCIGPPPTNGCNACVCTAGNWICGVQQCPPGDASRSDGPSTTSDASSSDASSSDASRIDAQPPPRDGSASDGPTLPGDASTDAPVGAVCGQLTCGLGEWCDTSGATPTCRCGLVGGACGAGLECCANLASGCAPLHCNERCLDKSDAGAAYTCP